MSFEFSTLPSNVERRKCGQMTPRRNAATVEESKGSDANNVKQINDSKINDGLISYQVRRPLVLSVLWFSMLWEKITNIPLK